MKLVLALLFLFLTSLPGIVLARQILPAGRLTAQIGIAMVVGLMLQLWLPLITSALFGIDVGPWLALVAMVLIIGIGISKKMPLLPEWRRPENRPNKSVLVIFLALWGLIGWLFYTHNLRSTAEGLSSAGISWEDQSFHAMLAAGFLWSDNLRALEYPHFQGWPLGYPFLSDLLPATLVKLGATLGQAFWWSAWYAATAFVLLFLALARQWIGGGMRGMVALLLFLTASGLGFVDFIREAWGGLEWPEVLIRHDYANGWELGLHYHNPLVGVLLPMRTSLFGMPVVMALLLLTQDLLDPRKSSRAGWWLVGVLVGLLPLIHAHSLLVIAVLAAVLLPFHWRTLPWRQALPAVGLALVLAAPQILWTKSQMEISEPFIRWHPGWMFGGSTPGEWVAYWWKNGGLRLPLGLLCWVWASPELRRQTLPLLIWLLLANLVAFQPFAYDNIKLLIFADMALVLLIVQRLAGWWPRGPATRIAIVALAILLSASGILSIARELRLQSLIVSWEGVAFAETVRAQSQPRDIFLTGSELTHPVPVLTGRPLVLGYTGWLGQHGVPLGTRPDDVRAMYAGGENAAALLKKYQVRHVVIGPAERREFPILNEGYFASLATVIFTVGDYSLYSLPEMSARN